jgi:hypothetical protein
MGEAFLYNFSLFLFSKLKTTGISPGMKFFSRSETPPKAERKEDTADVSPWRFI